MISDHRFTDLLRVHRKAVTAYAHAMAPDTWAAEDAVQETFLRAWRYRDTYRSSGSFEGWLIRICRNCLIDLGTRRVEQPVEHLPERLVVFEGEHELRDLVAHLPVQQREVVALCGLLGYDYAGAAELLGLPVGTVRSRLHRARASIAEQLGRGIQEGLA